ncbi:MAG: hypothetical protein GY705_01460 [Bacteroidetes bacterium]|nr:hypothetical protein [Bacteroidota bacterium]
MTTIDIDQDNYDYLIKRVRNFGETASDVLRRELGLNGKSKPTADVHDNHELSEILESSKVKHGRGYSVTASNTGLLWSDGLGWYNWLCPTSGLELVLLN